MNHIGYREIKNVWLTPYQVSLKMFQRFHLRGFSLCYAGFECCKNSEPLHLLYATLSANHK